MKIGIYGGSFNPVHFGHVNLAKKAVADLALDRLIVIPANVSPFKTEAAKDMPPLPWESRDGEERLCRDHRGDCR